jgi:ABC-type transport system involved in cytochrome bd biosynthesis fused ATPase/permease subunit
VRGADRVVVVEGGRIAEAGTHAQLLAQNGIYANLYRMTYEHAATTNGDTAGGPLPAQRPATT